MDYEVGKGKPPIKGRFQKGQSGNPEGARKHHGLKLLLQNDEIYHGSKISLEKDILSEIRETIVFSLTCTVKELEEALKDLKNLPIFKAIIYKTVLKATKKGNFRVLEILLKQVIGKV